MPRRQIVRNADVFVGGIFMGRVAEVELPKLSPQTADNQEVNSEVNMERFGGAASGTEAPKGGNIVEVSA